MRSGCVGERAAAVPTTQPHCLPLQSQTVQVQARLTKKGGGSTSGGKTQRGSAPSSGRKTLR